MSFLSTRRVFMLFGLIALVSASTLSDVSNAAEVPSRLNPNTATLEALIALDGVSSELAADIIAERPFKTIGAFDALLSRSLDDQARKALYPDLFVPIELNTVR